MLYTITFRSGAQQEFDLDDQAYVQLVTGFKAVHEKGETGHMISAAGGILITEVVGFHRYIPMAVKYGLPYEEPSRISSPSPRGFTPPPPPGNGSNTP